MQANRRRTLCGRLGSERGAQLVEFALVLPILLMLIAAIAEFGLLFQSYEVSTNAAREGARLAVLPGSEASDYAMVIARVNNYMAASGLPGTHTTAVTPESLSIGAGTVANGVRVTVTYNYGSLFIGPVVSIIGGTFANTITYSTSALMRTHVQAVAGP